MARALVVQHTAGEGLGRFAEWLPAAGVDVHPIHPYLGHRVPASVEGDALIVLGGPMGACDDDRASWLPAVRDLLGSAVEDGVPTLGICLGAQLLAVAAGGEVRVGAAGPELGLSQVQVAIADQLLDVGELPVVQWHHDEVSMLPESAVLLASSDRYRVQAFRLGEVAWGMQFHPEVDPGIVATWASEDATDPSVLAEVRQADDRLYDAGRRLADRFAAVVTG
jgi:GMP synthase-like glutamine amidotransferase